MAHIAHAQRIRDAAGRQPTRVEHRNFSGRVKHKELFGLRTASWSRAGANFMHTTNKPWHSSICEYIDVQSLIVRPCLPSSAASTPWAPQSVPSPPAIVPVSRVRDSMPVPTLAVLAFASSFFFFSALAFAIAALRALARSVSVWLRLAAIAARSAPTIPRWCLTVLRDRFLVLSSVRPCNHISSCLSLSRLSHLLVHAPIQYSPRNLARVLVL